MEKQYDLLVFIGRFQPFHNGHEAVVERALELSCNVAILCGSSNRPLTSKNPWTFRERESMIRGVFPKHDLFIESLDDSLYDDSAWVSQVNSRIEEALWYHDLPEDARVGIIGHFKDRSSYYLSLFPGRFLEEVKPGKTLNATDIRKTLFEDENTEEKWVHLAELVPVAVLDQLSTYSTTTDFWRLAIEHGEIIQDRKKKAGYPYGLNEVTTDAVVVHTSGQVLLIRRGGRIGKGLYALPGGFLNPDERIYDGCVRELLEETRIDLSKTLFADLSDKDQDIRDAVTRCELKRCFRGVEVFDHPERSNLSRLITHAHLFVIDTPYLPVVQGADDATAAFWRPLRAIPELADLLFDDHYDIIMSMTKGVK